MKPKLLVIELWGLGDLVIATEFLKAASDRFDVTLLAKPYAVDLQQRLWPGVRVVPFVAPWTAFIHKYRLLNWPWRRLFGLRHLARERFDIGLSARWDPRDHLLLWVFRARRRLGFPRMRSQLFLTEALTRPDPLAHRYESWHLLGGALGLNMPPRERVPSAPGSRGHQILVHTGAGQPIRVWPLERYRNLVAALRRHNYSVQVACDPDQLPWWKAAGENGVAAPGTVTELVELIHRAGACIGNDSGPSHLAAACDVPTLTLFGPQLPEWFAPLHPQAEWIEGKACPFKPCSDYCRFPAPLCLHGVSEQEVWQGIQGFLQRIGFAEEARSGYSRSLR